MSLSTNHWLGIALIAYLIGGVIEGIYAARQLAQSASELIKSVEAQSSETTEPPKGNLQVFAAIAAVSICGGFSGPAASSIGQSKEIRNEVGARHLANNLLANQKFIYRMLRLIYVCSYSDRVGKTTL